MGSKLEELEIQVHWDYYLTMDVILSRFAYKWL
jgi:hypothetical protein